MTFVALLTGDVENRAASCFPLCLSVAKSSGRGKCRCDRAGDEYRVGRRNVGIGCDILLGVDFRIVVEDVDMVLSVRLY